MEIAKLDELNELGKIKEYKGRGRGGKIWRDKLWWFHHFSGIDKSNFMKIFSNSDLSKFKKSLNRI